ncbi:ABC transporter substrate-binding protein [Streptomyces clavuligerus]|uniref:ABC transporter solute-binding protein n=1 Tax=Streptomyces clavuligerus TaxID=1901 RepID=B5GNY6_STRCL|nr:extracellular solute-binding protein [Streptomyces clavuligerus]ANW18962.1 ABC transporter substrate-binding protein [Streptomyces clavuligerus]AXU13540.1 extracellular solute-binding protein [Streptomyces clavuligerus]EDY48032.1 ABC transporter solute-binding protein [Streptomyces clavuligerus]EFG08326.1 ABC transporter solute-binding protein [Streptomyces clavuligerus]MBY6303501.1 extracellular solute-binding protein [Streptomyces clavuligerus]
MQRHYASLTAALAALGTTIALTGCGTSTGSSGDVTLTLIAADYDVNGGQSSKTYWDNLAKDFESKHEGIDVRVTIEPWTGIDRKVAQLVKEGKEPDIAQIGPYADYAAGDKLYSADQLLSIPVQSNFLRPLADAGEQRRVQYGLPFTASTRVLFYNKKLFAGAGVENPPTTWDELRSAAEQLKDAGVSYPYALPLGPEEAQIETMMWLLGGDSNGFVEPGGSYSIDSEENRETLEWVRSNLVEPGLVGPVPPSKLNRKQAFAAFTKGEVGMLNGHPSLLKEAEKAGIELGKVPVPGKKGKPKAAVGVADWIMGFKKREHREEIGKFFNFLFTDKNVLDFASQNDLLPPTVTASEAMEQDPDHADLKEFLVELPTSLLPPVNKTSWGTVSEEIRANVGRAVEPGGSPAKVLGDIAQKAQDAEAQEEE